MEAYGIYKVIPKGKKFVFSSGSEGALIIFEKEIQIYKTYAGEKKEYYQKQTPQLKLIYSEITAKIRKEGEKRTLEIRILKTDEIKEYEIVMENQTEDVQIETKMVALIKIEQKKKYLSNEYQKLFEMFFNEEAQDFMKGYELLKHILTDLSKSLDKIFQTQIKNLKLLVATNYVKRNYDPQLVSSIIGFQTIRDEFSDLYTKAFNELLQVDKEFVKKDNLLKEKEEQLALHTAFIKKQEERERESLGNHLFTIQTNVNKIYEKAKNYEFVRETSFSFKGFYKYRKMKNYQEPESEPAFETKRRATIVSKPVSNFSKDLLPAKPKQEKVYTGYSSFLIKFPFSCYAPLSVNYKPNLVIHKNYNEDFINYFTNVCTNKKFNYPTLSEPLTILQRACEKFQFSYLLKEAANCLNKYKENAQEHALNYISAFIIADSSLFLNRFLFPVFPAKGETYEFIDNKNKFIYLGESVSKSPPISAYFCFSKKFEFLSNTDFDFKLNAESDQLEITFKHQRKVTLINKEGEKITFSYNNPVYVIKNIKVGTIKFDFKGVVKIKDNMEKLVAMIDFNQNQNGEFIGGVYAKNKKDFIFNFKGNVQNKFFYYGLDDDPKGLGNCIWKICKEKYLKNKKSILTLNYYFMPSYSYGLHFSSDKLKKSLPKTDSRNNKICKAIGEDKIEQALNDLARYEKQGTSPKYFRESTDRFGKYYEYLNNYWEEEREGLV